jgi:photosystem II stability/assembly factor-like uncharacterized protein
MGAVTASADLRPQPQRVTIAAEHPGEAAAWRRLAWLDSNGQYPVDGLASARAHIARMHARAADLGRTSWTPLGPGNIGGRIRALLIHPITPAIMIAAGVSGGIWRSTDAGLSWAAVNDFLPHLSVSTMVFRPGDPSTVFAGTGESFAGFQGDGIFMSTDAGATWSALPSTVTPASHDFLFVNRLSMSGDGGVLMAATDTGVWRSTDLGQTWSRTLNLASLSPAPGRMEMVDVKFVPGSSTRVLAAGQSRNVYYSNDAGLTWTGSAGLPLQATPLGVRTELGVTSASVSTIYAVVDDLTPITGGQLGGGKVWRSLDGGLSFAEVGAPGHMSRQGHYNNTIWVDPFNPARLVIGGVDLWRSEDSGVTWIRISHAGNAPPSCAPADAGCTSAHADHHAIVSHPSYGGPGQRTVYFATDGGLYRTDDITAAPASLPDSALTSLTFTALNHALGVTQFYGADGDPATGRIVGGTQDNGTVLYTPDTGTEGWTTILGGDGGQPAIDRTNSGYTYAQGTYLKVFRRNAGSTGFIYGGNPMLGDGCQKAAPFQITDACQQQSNFVAPLVIDPHNAQRLLAGGRSLWRTNDARTLSTSTGGPSWAAIKGPTSGQSNISAIAVSASTPDIVWVGHNNGDLYLSNNATSATPAWSRLDNSTPSLPDRMITSVAVDGQNTDTVYVTFGGFTADNIWKTTNAGQTWTAVTGSGAGALPPVPVRAFAVHPGRSQELYAGTELGVFISDDGGATWAVPHVGPASVAVYQLFWLNTRLVAVTHGRGVFIAETDPPPTVGTIGALPAALRFGATKDGTAGPLVAVTPSQPVTVSFDGASGAWSAATTSQWLQVTEGSGSGAGRFTVAIVNPGNVIGSQTSLTGEVLVTAMGAPNSPLRVPVRLTVDPTMRATVEPLGVFDTPVQGAVVSGSIAVTGWALDDVAVDRVEIWRDAIPNDPAPPFTETGHPANGKVFVANGTFAEGTRPDVVAAYPAHPRSHRAGWGYLLLTWGLPNSNGAFVLTAIAWDAEGHHTTLGTKSITVDNANATKPFGSIDVPAYGATFSGHNFTFGWALTPNAACSVAGGQQVMTIDSAPPQFPISYGANRSDIASAFPGLADSASAGGAVSLDSRLYTNGVHAIGWLVYDSCGNGEGIGSRFFTILNGGTRHRQTAADALRSPGSSDPGASIAGAGPAFSRVGAPVAASRVAEASAPLWVVRGLGSPARPLARSGSVWLSQTGRIEIHAHDPSLQDSGLSYAAYLEQNGTLAPLPIGSSFDAARGSFYWQPVAGFYGTYPLRVVALRNDEPIEQWTVPIIVSPQADTVELQIDRPAPSRVEGPVLSERVVRVEGWAVDPRAVDDSGIGAVHVWSRSLVPGSLPRFLGAAALGVVRTDVANHFGRQFDRSGYHLTTPPLEPGRHELVVYAWSTRTGQWERARTVMVTVR